MQGDITAFLGAFTALGEYRRVLDRGRELTLLPYEASRNDHRQPVRLSWHILSW